MNTSSVFALIGMAVAAAVIIGVLGYWLERRRQGEFRARALALGLTYAPANPALIRKYRYLDKLRQAIEGSVRDILSGIYRGHPVHAFDYQFTRPVRLRREDTNSAIRHESIFLLEQDRRFPELRVYPAGMPEKAKRAVGLVGMAMDAVEFNRAFAVRGKDRGFATAVLHPRMMAFLLKYPGVSLEIEDTTLSIAVEQRLEPGDVQPYLDILVRIRQLMPEHLYEP